MSWHHWLAIGFWAVLIVVILVARYAYRRGRRDEARVAVDGIRRVMEGNRAGTMKSPAPLIEVTMSQFEALSEESIKRMLRGDDGD